MVPIGFWQLLIALRLLPGACCDGLASQSIPLGSSFDSFYRIWGSGLITAVAFGFPGFIALLPGLAPAASGFGDVGAFVRVFCPVFSFYV
jgi:hypothetical protein